MTKSEMLKARGNNFNKDSQLAPLSIPLVKRKVQSQVPSPTLQNSQSNRGQFGASSPSQANQKGDNQNQSNAQKKSQNQLTNLLINQPFEKKSELKKLILSRQSRRGQLGSARVRSVGHSQGSQDNKLADKDEGIPNPDEAVKGKAFSQQKRYSLEI